MVWCFSVLEKVYKGFRTGLFTKNGGHAILNKDKMVTLFVGINMSKQEFIEKLRSSLSGQVSAKLVEENMAYYEEYISSQIRMGQTEEEVLRSLGDPRLIAKSIISANADEGYFSERSSQEHVMNEESYYAERRSLNMPRVYRVHGWLAVVIVLAILALLIGAVFSLISFLFPMIVAGGIVYFFVKLFRDWLN